MAKVNNKTKGYNMISRDVVFDTSISDRARFLYVYMACKPESWDFYQDKVAEELGYTKDTLRKYLDELITRGWITEDEQRNSGQFGCLVYTIEIERRNGNLPIRKNTDTEKNRNGKNPNQRYIYNISEDKSSSIKRDIENKKRLSNDNQKVDYSDDFLEFWKLYHEGSKQQAYKEWNKLKPKEKEKAITLVDNYLKLCLYSGRKKKDVSSYLHQHGFDDDWLATPDCYVVKEVDNERMVKFKKYMVEKHQELIFHRNPITFEQLDNCFTKYTLDQTEWAMNKLKQRNIHQYFSILKGIEAIIEDDSEFDNSED